MVEHKCQILSEEFNLPARIKKLYVNLHVEAHTVRRCSQTVVELGLLRG